MEPTEPIVCGNENCRAVIGDPLELYGKVLLETDTLVIRHVSAICKKCGRPFHFSVSDHQLAELIGEVLKLREKHD